MEQELKTRWIEALRSGDYEQGTSYLCYNGYCCLGVLAEIDGKLIHYPEGPAEFRSTAGSCLVPANYHGLKEHLATLMHMNDEEGKSFNEIADWIEKNL